MIKCPKCGNELAPGAPFCPKCGVRFQVQTPPVTQTPINNPTQTTAPVQGQPINNQGPIQKPVTIKNDEPLVKSLEPEKDKKGNKNLLIIIIAVAVLVLGLFVYFSFFAKKTNKNTNNQVFEYKEIVTNGYQLKIKKEWYVVEGNGNVIIKDVNSELIIRLSNYKASYSNYSKDKIEKYLNNKDNIENPEISETKLGNFDALLVNANVKEDNGKTYNADYYYLKAGDNLIIGATIIYLKDNSKNDNLPAIKTMLQDISYAEDGLKATKETNEYLNTFGLYGNILSSSNNN